MAPASSASSASEGADDSVYQAKLASSLAGLPVRQGQHQQAQQAQNGTETAHGNGTKDAAPLSDTLDLAQTSAPSQADLAAQKLEQKRLEHEKQRALQKKAFEEQE
ncbi:hypothetical protein BMF94_5351 [Rhodotorula taiwanensis]|uniref:Uncharacterized protein n=1 Tax=Rhodotorula taiwanensis TaxID=741276 RepID=A0A2S5B4G9_9BASI|nr:hypothetical protein BMF94_5351 [Rhodotorula taiwanensis]